MWAGGRRASATLVAFASAAVLLTACSGQDTGAASQTSPGQSTQSGAGTAGSGSGAEAGGSASDLARSAPQRIAIPSLGVVSDLETLGQDAKGVMTTPKDPDLAGWYEPGPTPGSKGPAVIAGHVTWNGEDAVFKKLKTLKAGDAVQVSREDGKTATFAVERVEEYPKDEFPTVEVYKNLDHAGLRLVTCGGEFDEDRSYYPNNVVVFASMTGVA
ncbi:class F sortase [Streptomyces sp. ATCC 21386]|uniref:class F sortase n=1 Tax=Streptomyces sp. ATCC 21386 TaxID=2699428 RepID=UPI001BFF1179|nr:class F sortase [Streptomyces sp. ATCC 21386]